MNNNQVIKLVCEYHNEDYVSVKLTWIASDRLLADFLLRDQSKWSARRLSPHMTDLLAALNRLKGCIAPIANELKFPFTICKRQCATNYIPT